MMISHIKSALRRLLGSEPCPYRGTVAECRVGVATTRERLGCLADHETALVAARRDGWWAAFDAIEREYADHRVGLPSRVAYVRRTCSPHVEAHVEVADGR